MALRRAMFVALLIALAPATSASATTKVSTVVADAATSYAAGIGGGSSATFVYSGFCQVMRVKPAAGKDSATPEAYVGVPCGPDVLRQVWTAPTATTNGAGVGPDSPLAAAADGNLYAADSPLGLVHKITTSGTPTIVTIAGSGSGCTPPVDGTLAKDAALCNIGGLAGDPTTAGNFVVWDLGDLTDASHRVYRVSGTDRTDSTIKTVAGGCASSGTDAAKLCFPLNTFLEVAYLDSDTILLARGAQILEVTLSTGAVQTIDAAAGVTGVARGFDGGFFYSTACEVHEVQTGTDTVVAGTGTCDVAQRQDGVLATSTAFGYIRGIASYPGGALVLDQSQVQGFNSQIRLVDRTSLLTSPPPFTTNGNVSIDISTLDGTPASCYFAGAVAGGQTFPTCADPFVQSSLSDDNYLFDAWNSNSEGGDPTPAVVRWIVDTLAPSAPALGAPAADAAIDSAQPTFSWTAATDPFGNLGFAPPSGIDHYDLLIDGKVDSAIPVAGCCSAKPAAAIAEGSHTWTVRAVDKAGNSAANTARNLSFTSAPTAALTASPNPALAGATVKLDASASSDREGPIASYAFDLDGDGEFDPATSSATTATTFATPGSHTVGVRVRDGIGQTADATAVVNVNAPAIPAGLLGVTIDNGAQYTRDPNVTLGVKFPASITSILVSNDGGFLVPQAFPPQAQIKWRLDSSGPERLPKIVYVRFQTGLLISETFTDDIILDETPPVVQKASLSGSPAAANAAAKARRFTLKVKATDSNSGVQSLQVTANKRKPGKLLAYKGKLAVSAAARPKFVRARDRAGNFSPWKKLK